MEGCCRCSIGGRLSEILGNGFFEKGVCTFGRLRSRDSLILAGGLFFCGSDVRSGFSKGVTSFNDGRAGVGFTVAAGLTFGRVDGSDGDSEGI